MSSLLAKYLIEERGIRKDKVDHLLQKAKESGERLDSALVESGMLAESEMLQFYASQLGLPFEEDLARYKPNPRFADRVPVGFARNYNLVGLDEIAGILRVATCRPLDLYPMDELAGLLRQPIEPVLAPRVEINELINRTYAQKTEVSDEVERELEAEGMLESELEFDAKTDILNIATAAPIIKLVNTIFSQALRMRASDIHVQPSEHKLQVRYRVDGVLYDVMTPSKKLQDAIIARIKVMGRMDIAERRLPQDGRASIKMGDAEIDLRISTVPTNFGERAVIRILEKTTKEFRLSDIGFLKDHEEMFNTYLEYSNGIILLTGPTGSGKTTTLYAAIGNINRPDINILTIEDPIEYQMPGASQVEVNEKKGLTFARALRSFVRQDPDVILVGEIRDLETGQIAIQSALTGHLVFSTLHTNDAPSTVTRLVDLGVEPFLVSSSVICVVAQRLVRRICKECKQEYVPDDRQLKGFDLTLDDIENGHLWQGRGCEACFKTGYTGRTAIHEILPISERIKQQIVEKLPAGEIKRWAVQEGGMLTLRKDGVRKAMLGMTTLQEVATITQRDTF
ncbi:MAG: Flp pilus assembly complex ATPase component TadA [Planctomycetes bacterium]|nr:Flp pilus assembly complex ATPase component TadA [Planctomycetota bacterium]MCW8134639.1 Flp pilus assembly complex ATPase component TadA [Planctomycetota bacterium]